MKTIVLSSQSKKQFLVFETSKGVNELIEQVRAIDFNPEQAAHKELIHSDDLEAEVFSHNTFESNKDAIRSSAVRKKESEGFKYIGSNRGSQVAELISQNSMNVAGVSLMSSLFLGLCQVTFWLVIVFSIFVAFKIDILIGVSFAIVGIVGFGLIFILGDILKNIVEINKTQNKGHP